MMSGMPLETCWAFNKRWNNKFYYKVASCWLFLLIHTTMHGSMNIKSKTFICIYWFHHHIGLESIWRTAVVAYSRCYPVICTAEMRKTNGIVENVSDCAPIRHGYLLNGPPWYIVATSPIRSVQLFVNYWQSVDWLIASFSILVHSAAVHYCAHYSPSSDTTLNHNNLVYKLATHLLVCF